MFTFVHAADLHLDSPFKGVTTDDPRVAETLHEATFRAFETLVDLCIEQRVDALLVAGDVYDGADRSLRAQLRFRDGLARLAEHGIRSVVVHGNHDPLDGWSSTIAWPERVHILGGERVETVFIERDGQHLAAVSGISYPHRQERRRLHEMYRADHPGLFQIAMLHCNCGQSRDHEPYAPCRVEDLVGAGFDYWALGHVHERAVLHEHPHIVYPGNTQGRSIRECGERGAYVVSVEGSDVVSLRFHALDAVRWCQEVVSIQDVETVDALERRVGETIDRLRAEAAGRPVVCRITLTGRGPLYRDLANESALTDLETRAREMGTGDDPFVWVQRIESDALPEIDLARLATGEDLLGQVLRLSERFASPGELPRLRDEALAELFSHPQARKLLTPPDDEQLQHLLERAALLCVDLLEPDA